MSEFAQIPKYLAIPVCNATAAWGAEERLLSTEERLDVAERALAFWRKRAERAEAELDGILRAWRGFNARPQDVDPARCWPEDSTHENGDYFCRCITCGNPFIGHKRRVTCKLCTRPETSPSEGIT